MAVKDLLYAQAQSMASDYALTEKGVQADSKETYTAYEELNKEYQKDVKSSVDKAQNAIFNVGGGISRGGNLGSNTGFLSIQRPYLVMSIPNISLPDNYGHYYGYPCNMTCSLGELSGFTVVSDCHLDGFRCTKTELDEIEALLKQGVIL